MTGMALLVSLMLMTFGPASFTGTMNALAAREALWQLPVSVISSLPGSPPEWLGSRSPSGVCRWAWSLRSDKSPPRSFSFFSRTGAGAALGLGARRRVDYLAGAGRLVSGSVLYTSTWTTAVRTAVWMLFLATFLFSQVYRYRAVSNQAQRQQTKWIVFGISGALGGFLLATVIAGI